MSAAVAPNTHGLRRRRAGVCARTGLRLEGFRLAVTLVLMALPLMLAACADKSSSRGSATGTSNAPSTVNTTTPETFGAGELERRGVWDIVADEVTPYQSDTLYPGNPTSPPREGNQYVSVNWSLTNTSDEVQDVPVAPKCFELVDADGHVYIGGFINTMHTHPPEYFKALPGEEASRPLYYEVPATAAGWQYRSEC